MSPEAQKLPLEGTAVRVPRVRSAAGTFPAMSVAWHPGWRRRDPLSILNPPHLLAIWVYLRVFFLSIFFLKKKGKEKVTRSKSEHKVSKRRQEWPGPMELSNSCCRYWGWGGEEGGGGGESHQRGRAHLHLMFASTGHCTCLGGNHSCIPRTHIGTFSDLSP